MRFLQGGLARVDHEKQRSNGEAEMHNNVHLTVPKKTNGNPWQNRRRASLWRESHLREELSGLRGSRVRTQKPHRPPPPTVRRVGMNGTPWGRTAWEAYRRKPLVPPCRRLRNRNVCRRLRIWKPVATSQTADKIAALNQKGCQRPNGAEAPNVHSWIASEGPDGDAINIGRWGRLRGHSWRERHIHGAA